MGRPKRKGLGAHFHFHVVVVDGVFSEDGHGEGRFHEASCLQPDDWERLQATVQHRVLRDHLHKASGARHRHGLLGEDVTGDMPGTRRRRVGQATGGFSIDASVRIEGEDRQGSERLALQRRLGDLTGEVITLQNLGQVALELVRAVLAHPDLDPATRASGERLLGLLQDALPPNGAEEAPEAGGSLSLREAAARVAGFLPVG